MRNLPYLAGMAFQSAMGLGLFLAVQLWIADDWSSAAVVGVGAHLMGYTAHVLLMRWRKGAQMEFLAEVTKTIKEQGYVLKKEETS